MADFDLVTCNMIVKANGMMLGIYDLPRHMKKIAYMVGGEQHVISDIHMHGDKNATVFLVPGPIEIENRPVPKGTFAPSLEQIEEYLNND